MALLWHRVRPEGPYAHEAVRAAASDTFAAQLDALVEIGEVVPLSDLEKPRRAARARFALTFDDDDAGHVDYTLPILQERQLTATFYLSGRWREARGPYWWELLERRVRDHGFDAVAAAHGRPEAIDVPSLAALLTGTDQARQLAAAAPTAGPAPMSVAQAEALVAAGMEIGFHTVEHPSLPALSDRELAAAVLEGRDELADELGTAITRFAYPHGHVDDRVSNVVRAGDYRSAWTTSKRTVMRGEDPMRLGRWDLSRLDATAFRLALVRGLARPGP
jgi:peptidoglycan/xylan/chitin deacetylase (PgdA/CDA1 family)